MDFNVQSVNDILAAINAVNESIQKTQSYIDANTYSLDADSAVEISGVGGVLGFLGVLTLLVAPTTSASSVANAPFSISVQADGSSTPSSSLSGSLNVSTELGSSVNEVVGVGGTMGLLDVSTTMRGSVAGSSSLSAYINRQLLSGPSEASGGASGSLSVEKEFAGTCDGTTSSVGGSANLYL